MISPVSPPPASNEMGRGDDDPPSKEEMDVDMSQAMLDDPVGC